MCDNPRYENFKRLMDVNKIDQVLEVIWSYPFDEDYQRSELQTILVTLKETILRGMEL